jgi:molecular chaperone GrpE (heat shock protein)
MVGMKSNISIEDLQQERQELSGQLKARTRNASRQRSRLRRFLERVRVSSSQDLESFPEFHSRHYEKKYGEFRRSFELLDVQIQSLLEKLAEQAVTPPAMASYPASKSIDEWQDHLDDLEETFEDYERRLERQYRADLLGLIKAMDTVERVITLDIPGAMSSGKEYYSALEQLKQTTQNLGKRLRNSLRGRHVKVVALSIGQYPPLATTRIVSREDSGTSDHVVVTQVVEKGYLWKGKVLRKAAVIIATQQEED